MKSIECINVFCSASLSDRDNVEKLLIPSLEKLAGGYKLHLHLIDYTGTNKLVIDSLTGLDVTVHQNRKQLGFGAAHNFLFDQVKPSDFFLIINPDIYCNRALLQNLLTTAGSSERAGIIEGRQLPYEHPKGYDQDTMETNWASGACIFVNPEFYAKVGGFDEAFWMYCEDVDLSWQCWLAGYRVIHCPEAVAYHYTGAFFEYRDDKYYHEQLWSGLNYLYLSYKYWGNLRLWRSMFALSRQDMPKPIKQAILAEFKVRKAGYRRAKVSFFRLAAFRNKIGITGFNRYK